MQWTILANNFELMEMVIERCSDQNFQHSNIQLEYFVMLCILHDRDGFVPTLLYTDSNTSDFILNPVNADPNRFNLLELCVKFGRTKIFEEILQSHFVCNFYYYQDIEDIFSASFDFPTEYVVIAVEKVLMKHKRTISNLERETLDRILKILIDRSNPNEKELFFAMNLAFSCGFYEIVEKLLNQRKWKDSELVDILKENTEFGNPYNDTSFPQVLNLVLTKLSDDVILNREEIEKLLVSYINKSKDHCFDLLWNNLHAKIATSHVNFARYLLLYSTKFAQSKFFGKLIPQVGSLSDECECEFESDLGNESAKLMLKVDLKTACWLSLLNTHKIVPTLILQESFSLFGLKMTEELFDLSLKLIRFDNLFLLRHPFAKARSWFTDARLHKILNHSCKFVMNSNLAFLIENFPNLDFSKNGNEAMRLLITTKNEVSDKIGFFSQLVKQLSLTTKEQNELRDFARENEQSHIVYWFNLKMMKEKAENEHEDSENDESDGSDH